MTKTRQKCDDCGSRFEVAETEKYKLYASRVLLNLKKMNWFY
jgi:hypothetical protein